MAYSEFLTAAKMGTARVIYEDGSTFAVYQTPAGRTEYQHFCYGDHRTSYANDGFESDDGIIRIPVRED